jgi:hypothetical protein
MRIQTKQQREAILQGIKDRRTQAGYSCEIYKGLTIHTLHDTSLNSYFLEVYKDSSTNALFNYRYRETQYDQMLKRIQQTKDNYDSNIKYKEERKANQKGRLTGAAACADAIRAELKKVFPSVKFSVRSSTFSMGDSVDISWTDGNTTDEVNAITKKYQYGSFNGMEDIYENTDSRDDIPQAKYVHCSRRMSAETEELLKPIAERIFDELKKDTERPFNCWDASQFLYQIFCKTSFVGKPVTIVYDGEYKIQFEQSEQSPTAEPINIDADSIAVIEYGKGIAVIGNTKPIKDDLKAIGGRFNPHLTCGAGWVFPMSKLDEVKQLLNKTADNREKPTIVTAEAVEQARSYNEALPAVVYSDYTEILEVLPTPPHSYKLEYLTILWHEGYQKPSFEKVTFNDWENIQSAFTQIWDTNEKGSEGGYTKVKVELKLQNMEAMTFRVDITNKINNGDFNPSACHIVDYLRNDLEIVQEQAQMLPAFNQVAQMKTNILQLGF